MSQLPLTTNSLFACIFIAAILTSQTPFLPPIVEYLPLLITISFATLFFIYHKKKIHAYKIVLVSYSLLVLIMLLKLIISVSSAELIRVPVFAIFTFCVIFIVPKVIDYRQFMNACSLAVLTMGIMSLPAVFILGQYSLGIGSWNGNVSLFGITIHPLTGIFESSNAMAFLTAFSLIGLLSKIDSESPYTIYYQLTFVSNLIILSLTLGRTGIIGFFLSISFYGISNRVNKKSFKTITIICISATIIFVLTAVGFTTIPYLSGIDLGGRSILWRASIVMSQDNLLFGSGWGNSNSLIYTYTVGTTVAGMGPHNSYLRVLLTSGIIGLFSYLLFHIYILLTSVFHLETKKKGKYPLSLY